MSNYSEQHALIILGGHAPDPRVLALVPESALVVCADSGLDHALELGLHPHVVIGDFDSATSDAVEHARSVGSILVPFDADKDLTDAELALHFVLDQKFSDATVLWGGGDRIDHVLGVMAALAHPRLSSLSSLSVWVGRDQLRVVHADTALELHHRAGTTISLLPLGSESSRVTTSGLQWELVDETLEGHAARGVSNVVVNPPTRIVVHHGVLAVIVPDDLISQPSPGAARRRSV